jgi:hypothetical protein
LSEGFRSFALEDYYPEKVANLVSRCSDYHQWICKLDFISMMTYGFQVESV